MLEDLHSRLAGVVIECLEYGSFIQRYDGPGTLFYLDPPYWGCENDYGKDMFTRNDFAVLAMDLAQIEGRFVMSINDVDGVRSTFAAFDMATVTTRYTIEKANGPRKDRPELLISNFPIRLP